MKEVRVTWKGSLAAQSEHERAVAEANRRRKQRKIEEAKLSYQASPVRKKHRKNRKRRRGKSYASYIQSPKWKKKAKQAIEHFGGKCAVCGSREQLEVHHKTYTRLGREKMEDLEVLCSGCHSIEHEDKYAPRDELTKQFLAIIAD